MEENELQFEQSESEVPALLSRANPLIEEGKFTEALTLLEKRMDLAYEDEALFDCMKAIMFWTNKETTLYALRTNKVEFAERLVSYYNNFEKYIELLDKDRLYVYYSIRLYVFGSVKSALEEAYREQGDKRILYALGRSLVETEEYAKAIETFEYLRKQDTTDAYVLSYLAEAYYFIGDERLAKYYIREALFYDPLSVPLDELVNDIIADLVDRVKNEGFVEKEEVLLWMGVYGELHGVLNVTKTMNEDDALALKKRVSRLEADYKVHDRKRQVEPLLLLAYFRFVAYLLLTGGENAEIERALARIREVNPSMFEEYLATMKS